ncbi:MAG: hypothetical protein ACJ8DO_07665, partial [Microvirga sp.]
RGFRYGSQEMRPTEFINPSVIKAGHPFASSEKNPGEFNVGSWARSGMGGHGRKQPVCFQAANARSGR